MTQTNHHTCKQARLRRKKQELAKSDLTKPLLILAVLQNGRHTQQKNVFLFSVSAGQNRVKVNIKRTKF